MVERQLPKLHVRTFTKAVIGPHTLQSNKEYFITDINFLGLTT